MTIPAVPKKVAERMTAPRFWSGFTRNPVIKGITIGSLMLSSASHNCFADAALRDHDRRAALGLLTGGGAPWASAAARTPAPLHCAAAYNSSHPDVSNSSVRNNT